MKTTCCLSLKYIYTVNLWDALFDMYCEDDTLPFLLHYSEQKPDVSKYIHCKLWDALFLPIHENYTRLDLVFFLSRRFICADRQFMNFELDETPI
jgi:hypothetical protein